MDDDLLKEFSDESREHLATIEEDLLRLEAGGSDIDEALVNKVFRAAHSIKGGASFFGFVKVKELAHRSETVLDLIRSRKMVPNAEITNVLLAAFDRLREMIDQPQESEAAEIDDLLEGLSSLASSYLPATQKQSLHTDICLTAVDGTGTVTLPQIDVERAARDGRHVYWIDLDLIHDVEQRGRNVLSLFRELSERFEVLDCAVDVAAVGDLDDAVVNRVPLRLVLSGATSPDAIGDVIEGVPPERIHLLLAPPVAPLAAPPVAQPEPAVVAAREDAPPAASPAPQAARGAPSPAPASARKPAASQPADETLRVNVSLLETLMNLAGELVLSRNQLRAAVARDDRELLAAADQRVNQVTSELQDVIMQTRLQPIGNLFAKFPRVVRDLAATLGKQIDLDVRGQDVALDKTLIEGLSDPLTHMVRNAVDHGIETTDQRIRQGKKPTGTVRIEARHEAGQVLVEIADDGKGLDPERVAEAAVRKGMIDAETVQGLSTREKQALIFMPGLSTVQQVSDLSGRGVGMDVVKTNLDRLGGQVEISSEVGKGSTFRIKLPLTLAIMPSLIATVGDERFAIPQASIEELLRLRAHEVASRVEIVGDCEVLRLRDRILPLARLATILGRTDAQERSAGRSLEVAVVDAGSFTYGLVVDAFHDTEEVVVKPLGARFKNAKEYAGATILGDGGVALILDIGGVAARAGLSTSAVVLAGERTQQVEQARGGEVASWLLFHGGPAERCGVPLDIVARIERISGGQVERLGARRTMQYRGGSLPLLALADAASVAALDSVEQYVVLVASVHGRDVGLLGALPIDIVESDAAIDTSTHRQVGIAGSAIIGDQTTLLVDLHELVTSVHPGWRRLPSGEAPPRRATQEEPEVRATSAPPAADAMTILLAEDSDFFRNQVKRFLEEEGFVVLAAPDGEAAWALLLNNVEAVSLVVTDIEMPRLDGLGLAARIRADARTESLPIIAVTSLAADEDQARGFAAGIDDYQVKLDRDSLLASIRERAAICLPVLS